MDKPDTNDTPKLLKPIIGLINQTSHIVAKTVNHKLTLLYWNIGKNINDEILKNDRADYGKKLILNLSYELSNRYGSGFNKINLHSFIKLNNCFSRYYNCKHTVCKIELVTHQKSNLYRKPFKTGVLHSNECSRKPEQTIVNELKIIAGKLEKAIALAENINRK